MTFEKPGKVFIHVDGHTQVAEFDHVDPRDSYCYCADVEDSDTGGKTYINRRYIPWNSIVEVLKEPAGANKDTAEDTRNATLQESADTENDSLAEFNQGL